MAYSASNCKGIYGGFFGPLIPEFTESTKGSQHCCNPLDLERLHSAQESVSSHPQ